MSGMPWLTTTLLIGINFGLIWLLMAAPAGERMITARRKIAASNAHLWSALFPFGNNALWDGTYISIQRIGDNQADVEIAWDGRDGQPIRRTIELSKIESERCFSLRVLNDTSLHNSFWANHSETVTLQADGDGTLVTITETDRYRGYAFPVFRYFKNRRHLHALAGWAETGAYKKSGWFESFPAQAGMAVLSVLILWPFFGLTSLGLLMSAVLTAVVVAHEAGHMFAFRAMGHKTARMIILPFLGGIALGGRPYNTHFEVGFSALMGAGMSVFPVIAAIMLFKPLEAAGYNTAATIVGAFGAIGAVFNLGNLVPVWKFDGGQVIRQVFRSRAGQGIASFLLLGGLLLAGNSAGFSSQALLFIGAIFALLSVVTTGSGVKPKFALVPMTAAERVLVFTGLIAAFTAHAFGTVWGFTVFLT
jgi:Zn-dependent protease